MPRRASSRRQAEARAQQVKQAQQREEAFQRDKAAFNVKAATVLIVFGAIVAGVIDNVVHKPTANSVALPLSVALLTLIACCAKLNRWNHGPKLAVVICASAIVSAGLYKMIDSRLGGLQPEVVTVQSHSYGPHRP